MLVLTYHSTWYHVTGNLSLNNKAFEELQPAKKETGQLLSTAKFYDSKNFCNELNAMSFLNFMFIPMVTQSILRYANVPLREKKLSPMEGVLSKSLYIILMNRYQTWSDSISGPFLIAPPLK